jgi:hypothetical protein
MIRVEYGVTTVGAKEGFVPELLNCASISNADDLSKDNLTFKNFANPCEEYSVLLDGANLPIPENTEDENMGVWSEFASNENGEFENVLPTITLVSDELFSVEGLGLEFDTNNNVYPTEFSISWYNGENLISLKEYNSSSVAFSTMEDVDNFDKIVLIFKKMNTPYSRLKLHSIQYGSILIIDEKSIQNIRIHQAVSPISTTIPVSTLSLSFLNLSNANYNFAVRQSLKVIDNDVLVGKYFIENSSQTNRKQWNIKAQDYINILEGTEFEGGIYVDELALNILTDIFGKANVPFTIAEELSSEKVTGYIPYTTCNKALQQVLFAIGAYANTAYSENVDVLPNSENIAESIGFDRIFQGQTISIDAAVTELELVAHTYTPIDTQITLHQASTVEENIKVIFNEPAYDLTIENGEIIESGVNYAIINCSENGVLKGKRYEHLTFSKSKLNTDSKTRKANKKTIKNGTLISYANIDKILNICYNYIIRNSTIKSRIVEGDTPLMVGKAYEVETELLGKVSGVLSEQNFSLYGGKKVVKETVIK